MPAPDRGITGPISGPPNGWMKRCTGANSAAVRR